MPWHHETGLTVCVENGIETGSVFLNGNDFRSYYSSQSLHLSSSWKTNVACVTNYQEIAADLLKKCCLLPIVGTLADLRTVLWLLLNSWGIWWLLFYFDHIRGAGLGSGGETAYSECRGTIGVQTFGLQLCLCQKNLPPLNLLFQLFIVRLYGEKD